MDFIKQYKMCLKKKMYFSENMARAALKDNEKKYKKKFRFYKCPRCKCWHLTTNVRIKVVINKNIGMKTCYRSGKVCYPTEEKAVQSKETKVKTYFCSICQSYHNTTHNGRTGRKELLKEWRNQYEKVTY